MGFVGGKTDTLDDPESVHKSVRWDQQCLLVRVVRLLWVLSCEMGGNP